MNTVMRENLSSAVKSLEAFVNDLNFDDDEIFNEMKDDIFFAFRMSGKLDMIETMEFLENCLPYVACRIMVGKHDGSVPCIDDMESRIIIEALKVFGVEKSQKLIERIADYIRLQQRLLDNNMFN